MRLTSSGANSFGACCERLAHMRIKHSQMRHQLSRNVRRSLHTTRCPPAPTMCVLPRSQIMRSAAAHDHVIVTVVVFLHLYKGGPGQITHWQAPDYGAEKARESNAAWLSLAPCLSLFLRSVSRGPAVVSCVLRPTFLTPSPSLAARDWRRCRFCLTVTLFCLAHRGCCRRPLCLLSVPGLLSQVVIDVWYGPGALPPCPGMQPDPSQMFETCVGTLACFGGHWWLSCKIPWSSHKAQREVLSSTESVPVPVCVFEGPVYRFLTAALPDFERV